MHLLWIRYSIVLLAVLIQKFGSAHMKNVAPERTTPAKVATNLYKPPWLNLNNSWINEVESHCRNDIVTLFERSDAGEIWALRMFDAASKVPSGILTGNIHDLGMYGECVGVKSHENPENIQGRHCMVSLAIPGEKFGTDAATVLNMQKISVQNPSAGVEHGLTTSVCLPSSCGVEDVVSFVNASIQNMPELIGFENMRVVKVTCSNVESTDDLSLGRFLTISMFVTIAIFLLACTVCDSLVRAGHYDTFLILRTAAKFSLYTNAIKLFNTELSPESMPAMHGFRFLNTCLIVIGHRIVTMSVKPWVNIFYFFEFRYTVPALITLMMSFVVDTFFIMSGFLTAYSFLNALRAGKKINVLLLYVHRYLRLTPCIIGCILFTIYILPLLGSAPMWESIVSVTSDLCRKNWWTNLLYIHNFVNKEEMCMLHTWYLACDMHFFWICPMILYPLHHRPKLGLAILGLLLITSLIVPSVQLVMNHWPAFWDTNKTFAEMSYIFLNIYTITYNRALPYFIGILLGYVVVNNKKLISEIQVLFNWILACSLILFCGWLVRYIQPVSPVFDVVGEVLYVTVARLAWSIAVAWILYACTQGYGGSVTSFLSLPIFVPLSRISYCIYLVHAIFQMYSAATLHTAGFISYHNDSEIRDNAFLYVYLQWVAVGGDIVISIGLGFVLNLCVETPVIVLEKILRSKRSSKITKRSSRTTKKEKVSAIIGGHLSLAKHPVDADLRIETRMLQLDFWQTVSDVLKSLGKGPTKTPAELAKTWQAWKSDVLERDTEQNTNPEDIQNMSTQSQPRTLTIEQELLIFLAAVSCDSDEIASSKESEILEIPKSQLYFRNLQDEDLGQLSASNSIRFTKKIS